MQLIQIAPSNYEQNAILAFNDIGIELTPDFIQDMINLIDNNISNLEPIKRSYFRKYSSNLKNILVSMGKLTPITTPEIESVFDYTNKLFVFGYIIPITYNVVINKEETANVFVSQNLLVLGLNKEEADNKIKNIMDMKKKEFISNILNISDKNSSSLINIFSDNSSNTDLLYDLFNKNESVIDFITNLFIKDVSCDINQLQFINSVPFVSNPTD